MRDWPQATDPISYEEPPLRMTTYLPGDILKMRDGTIGMVQAAMRNGVSWNDPGFRYAKGNETYSLVRIPGVPFSKASWWNLEDVHEPIFGAMHALLARLNGEPEVERIEG